MNKSTYKAYLFKEFQNALKLAIYKLLQVLKKDLIVLTNKKLFDISKNVHSVTNFYSIGKTLNLKH